MKAQTTPEFMVVYAVMIAIFLGVFAIYFSGSITLFQAQDAAAALRNAYAVAAALNYVYLAGDGASYNFTLTNAANAENITISAYEVESRRAHASAVAPLLDANVNVTTLGRGDMHVTNNKGEIDIGK
jgi:hypothetical protein